jgi:hypothetical protein
MSLGALGYVGYAEESTDGTFISAPTNYLPVTNFSFEDTNDFIVPDQIRHSRDHYIAMAAPYNVSGSMEMELIPTDVRKLLKSAWAASVATSAYSGGGYQHVFTPASTEPTFTFESSAADILVMQYAGVRVNTLEIKAAFGEIVTASFGLEGLNRQKKVSPATPSYTNVLPFHFTGADVHVSSGTLLTTVKDFTFGSNNNFTRIGTLRRTRAWKRMAFGMREVTLAMNLDFTEDSEYDRFLNETIFDVDLFMEGQVGLSGMGVNTPVLRLQPTNVRWNRVSIPLSAGDYLSQAVEALVISPIGGNIFTGTLVNTETAAANW